jgi:nucleoid-associated protein YgaU
MARKREVKKEEKKGILGKAIDAVSARDEKEAAEKAEQEAAAARAEAAREAAQKRAAESRAKTAQARAQQAEKEAAEAKSKLAQLEREKRMEEMAERREEARQKALEREEAKARVYVVKSGDSLSKIAKAELGDANRWPEIFELNKDQIKDPNLIHPGQELKMPAA